MPFPLISSPLFALLFPALLFLHPLSLAFFISLPFSFFLFCYAVLCWSLLRYAVLCHAMLCSAVLKLFCLLLVFSSPVVRVLIFQFFIPFLCSHLLILKLIQFLFILIQGPVKRKRPPKNRSSAGPFQNTHLSSSAQTHTLKKLRSASKCRECDSYVYFNGAECEVCGLTCHKKCLGRLSIKCGTYNVRTT